MQRIQRHLKNAFIPHHGNDYRPHALRHKWLHTYTAVVIAAKVIIVGTVAFYGNPARLSDISPTAIVTLTNESRQQNRVGLLKTSATLTKAAELKARDMAQKNYFAHVSPSGVTPWTWFKKAGYSYTYAGENLAMDFVASEDVVAAWLRSPSHRKNLLSSKYKDIGVAVTSATIKGAPSLIVVQMFGAPVPAPVKKTVTVPSQTPTPSAAKTTAGKLPVPKQNVLGESAPVIAPVPPSIITPADASVIRTARPEVVGQAEPNSTVTLYVNGERQATAVTSSQGVFSISSSGVVPDGSTTIQVTATARGLTSAFSPMVTATVDTAAPTINSEQTTLLPSYFSERGYDVFVTVDGSPTTIQARVGGAATMLAAHQGEYVGNVVTGGALTNSVVTLTVADAAGNSTRSIIADTAIFSNGVVSSTEGPIIAAVRLIFFSRTFLMTMLFLLAMAMVVNIGVEWRHQHHPTIIHSLLLFFLVGTFLVL